MSSFGLDFLVSLFQFQVSLSASSNCSLCFAGRFRLSGITRVTAGASPEFRAARRASLPLSIFFFRRFMRLDSTMTGGRY
jgi:hypothetical protein